MSSRARSIAWIAFLVLLGIPSWATLGFMAAMLVWAGWPA